MDTAQRVASLACLLADDAQSIGSIIAADIKEVADSVCPQDLGPWQRKPMSRDDRDRA
jgi:hypothetical protein